MFPRVPTRYSITEGLNTLLHPERCVIYARTEQGYVPVFVGGSEPAAPGPILPSNPLIAVLERRMSPVAIETSSGRIPKASHLTPFERATLEELEVQVVAPVRDRQGLGGFFCLGRKRSGDVFTSSDVAWLATVAERVSTELQRFEGPAVLRNKQADSDGRLAGASDHHHAPSPHLAGDRRPSGLGAADSDAAPTQTMWSTAAECPKCGVCYDTAGGRCQNDGVGLIPLPLPRHLAGRYRLDRRIGDGGMGAV